MQVGVEHNDGEGQDEYRVRIAESSHHLRIAHAVTVAEHFHEPLDLLRLAGHPEVSLELAQSHVDLHGGQVELLDEVVEGGHVERVLQIAQVLADHLLADALARNEKFGHSSRRVLQESFLRQISHAPLGFLVEKVQSDAILALPDALQHLGLAGRHRIRLLLLLLRMLRMLRMLLLLGHCRHTDIGRRLSVCRPAHGQQPVVVVDRREGHRRRVDVRRIADGAVVGPERVAVAGSF